VAVDTPELQVALMNLGVLEGDICRIVNIAPLGDPIAIAIHGTKICIRKKDAHSIWVKP
jgi:ferrous iron transport protein A